MVNNELNVDQNILELIWNNSNEVIFTIGFDGRLLSANPAFRTILGWEMSDINEQNPFPFFIDFSEEEHQRLLTSLKNGQDIPYYEAKRMRKDGAVLNVIASYRAINQGDVLAVGMYKDFTEQMQNHLKLQKSEAYFRNFIEMIPDAIFIEQNDEIIYVNSAAVQIAGVTSKEELLGKSIRQFVEKQKSSEFFEQIMDAVASKKQVVEQLCRLDGTYFWAEVVAMQNTYNDERVLQILVRDVTLKKNHQQQLEYLAFHDPLTGLLNRRYFTDKINDAVDDATKEGKMLGVLYIDIDKFKGINDSLGHDVGDQLLVQFADRLKENVRDGDLLCRNGGDEFLVLLTDIHSKKDAAMVASRLNYETQKPYIINNQILDISASIGISLFPHDGLNSKTLILRSDEALYKAKLQNNCYRFYE